MKTMEQNSELIKKLRSYQQKEITEHSIYNKLAAMTKDEHNRKILEKISRDELAHYEVWKKHTGREFKPSGIRVLFFVILCRLFGLTFGIKLLEKGEGEAEKQYEEIRKDLPDADRIIKDEHEHEEELIKLLDEERLRYVGSIVLGLNDALVELTGGLAGLTLALRKPQLIALSGLIVGISAALSMSASEYFSTKAEDGDRKPLKSSVYTGIAYIITVMFLVSPFLVLRNPFISLALTITLAVIIVAVFNFYLTIAKDKPFLRPFSEMVFVSLFVAAVSFGVGYLLRLWLGVDV
jgi:vacuolar iron transporter family protein